MVIRKSVEAPAHAALDRRAVAAIHLVMDGAQLSAEGRLVEDGAGAIARAVVHGDQRVLPAPAVLDDAGQVPNERRLFVVGGDDDGQRRHDLSSWLRPLSPRPAWCPTG
jgi:hypothetical protein